MNAGRARTWIVAAVSLLAVAVALAAMRAGVGGLGGVDPGDAGHAPFLVLVNGLMIGLAALATWSAWRWLAATRALAGGTPALLVACGLLLAGEIACAALEIWPDGRGLEWLGAALWGLARLVVIGWAALAARAVFGSPGGLARWAAGSALSGVVAAVAIGVVAWPLSRSGPGLDAALAWLDLAALVAVLFALARTARATLTPTALALGGAALYLVTDLVQLGTTRLDDPGFAVGEVGYFAGYVAIALAGFDAVGAASTSTGRATDPRL